ncbi:MAG: DUF4864 domain-containing protein [Opitutaceae bacterium]
MKRWIAILLVGGCCAGATISAGAAEGEMPASRPEVKKEIVATIEGQLTAFRKGEVEKAYGFAAAELRAQKPLRTFAAIVEANYPEIWANTRADYGIARDDGVRATLIVKVFSQESDATYDFTLVRERVGWRIYGVLRREPKQKGKV